MNDDRSVVHILKSGREWGKLGTRIKGLSLLSHTSMVEIAWLDKLVVSTCLGRWTPNWVFSAKMEGGWFFLWKWWVDGIFRVSISILFLSFLLSNSLNGLRLMKLRPVQVPSKSQMRQPWKSNMSRTASMARAWYKSRASVESKSKLWTDLHSHHRCSSEWWFWYSDSSCVDTSTFHTFG